MSEINPSITENAATESEETESFEEVLDRVAAKYAAMVEERPKLPAYRLVPAVRAVGIGRRAVKSH